MPKTPSVNDYELTFILGEKASPEDAAAKNTEIHKWIEKLEGSVTKEEVWGRRELAYIIDRNRSGFYITLWLSMPGGNLKALEQQLRFDESVIRFLTTKAYTTAQPGSLYPVVEEKPEKGVPSAPEDSTSGEEMLRRGSTSRPKKTEPEETTEDIPDEERLKKLDETLEELFKEEE